MATQESIKLVTMTAGQDLRGDQYEILQIEDDGGAGKVIKATAVTNTVVGVLYEKPNADIDTDGNGVAVAMLHGKVKLKAGGTVTAGGLVVPDVTAGRVVTVANAGALAADSMAIGVALETAADGEIFTMIAMPIGAPHSS